MVYDQLVRLTVLYMYFWFTVICELFWLGKWLVKLVAFVHAGCWAAEQWDKFVEYMNSPPALTLEDTLYRTNRTREARLAKATFEYVPPSPLQYRPFPPCEPKPSRYSNHGCYHDNDKISSENGTKGAWEKYIENEKQLRDNDDDLSMILRCPLPCDDYQHLTDDQKSELLAQIKILEIATEYEAKNKIKNDSEMTPSTSKSPTNVIYGVRRKKKLSDLDRRIVSLFHQKAHTSAIHK